MAFENPFLQPSAVRESALEYLWSDAPEDSTQRQGGSIVNNAFNLEDSSNTIAAIAANVAQNNGEYNPGQSLNPEDYDPVAALNGLNQYGGIVKGVAGMLGFGGIAGLGMKYAEQKAANDIDTMLQSLQGQTSGQSNLGTTALGGVLGMFGLNPFGVISGANKDSVANAKGLASNFQTVDQLAGYITGTDPAVQNIVGGMFTDWSTITPAQYGTVANQVGSYIQNKVASGMSLPEAQRVAANRFNPVDAGVPGNNPDESSSYSQYSGAGESQTQAALRSDDNSFGYG